MTAEVDVLNMTDEEFAAFDVDSMAQEESEEVADPEEIEENGQEEASDEPEDEDTDEEPNGEDEEGEDSGNDSTEAPEDPETTPEEEAAINFEEEYKKLLTPFKANGKEVQVNNVQDAITLMQMGANYNKKMAGLKPNLKLIKMLDNSGLLSESKLSYLIDLDKKDPAAVKKFIKESGVDLLELDPDAPVEYTPNTYTVDDKEVDLDSILDEIRDTKSYNDTVDIISNKWDDSSKQVLLANPSVIKVINEHVESGIYQQINKVIESERMLGRLSGVSDIEAYRQVGELLSSNGSLQAPVKTESPNVTPKKTVDPKLTNRKKATGSTKTTATKKVQEEFNPLNMTDEEFEKFSSKYM